MNAVDVILNLAALLLWFSWRSFNFLGSPSSQVSALSLLSTLKRTEFHTTRKWIALSGLFLLLFVRSFFYWHIGSAVSWTPVLDLGAIALPFRSDYPQLMVLFSFLSFALILGGFYSWLLFISMVNSAIPDTEPMQKLVRIQLGWIEHLPPLLRFLLTPIAAMLLWIIGSKGLVLFGIVPVPESTTHLLEQALVLGLASLLVWKWLIFGLFLLQLLNSYVYLGNWPMWNFVNFTTRNLLRPFNWIPLQLGKVDFAPILGIALVLIVSEYSSYWFPKLYQRLPLSP